MKINNTFKEQYDQLFERVQEAKRAGLKVKTYLFEDADFGIALIKSKDGQVINPILVSNQESPLASAEDAVLSGLYLLIMALAAEGAADVLDHPKFEECVVKAMEKISLLIGYSELSQTKDFPDLDEDLLN